MGLLDVLGSLGKGLGLSQPQVGTPGINPGAPDPRQKQGGLGLSQPQMPPMPDSGGAADLSDVPMPVRFIMALDDGLKHNEGMPGAGDRLRQQRQQDYDRRRQAWGQNLDVIEKMRGFLDTVPLQDRDGRAAALRKNYEQQFGGPGSGELFDLIVGEQGAGGGLSQQLRDDPEVQALLASNPQAGMIDVKKIASSPAFMKRAVDRQDQELMPEVEKRISGLLNSQAPSMRAAVEKVMKDGQVTIEEVKQLNELAGDGPDGTRLTHDMLGTADRQQELLAQRIHGFTTSGEFNKQRDDAAAFEKFTKEETLKHKFRMEEELAKLAAKPGISGLDPAQRQILLADYKDNLKQSQGMDDAVSSLQEMDRILASAEKAIKKVSTGPLAKYVPDSMRHDTEAFNQLQQAFGTEWVQTVQGMRGLGQLSDREGDALAKTTGGFDKDERFNASDIAARRKLIKFTIQRKKAQKGVAQQELNNTRKLAELPDRGFAGGATAVEKPASGATGKPKTVIQNGHTYTLNESTGEYE